MNTPFLALLLLYALALLASVDAHNRRSFGQRRNRIPTALRRFNITFLRGGFALGPTTISNARCANAFFNPILPSTLQVALSAISTNGMKTMPSADNIVSLQQVNGTGLFRIGDREIKMIARGPVFRGRYVFIIAFDGRDISTIVGNVRIFKRFFRRRVIFFIKLFRIRRVRNLLRNRRCRRMLTRKFLFPSATPEPEDPQPVDPTPGPEDMDQDTPQEPTPGPQETELDSPESPEPDAQPEPAPETTPAAEQGMEPEEDSGSTGDMNM